MFQGSIPQDVRAILFEATRGWQSRRIAVACSGNFTVERVLHEHGCFDLAGCDVSIYSCALGAWFARQPFDLTLKDDYHDLLGWVLPGMETPAGALATLVLMSNFSEALKPGANAYYLRLMDGYRRQWPELHAKTVAKLESVPLRLAEFHGGDAVDWLDTLPEDTAVISFPPFFAKGYEVMWKMLDTVFAWNKPVFQEIFEEHRRRFIEALTRRNEWLFMTSYPLDEYLPNLRGMAKTTLRGVPMYLYASHAPTRIAVPRQHLVPVAMPRLAPGETIGSTMALLPLSAGQFTALRAQYLNPKIAPAGASGAYGVLVDDRLVGVFAFNFTYQSPVAVPDTVYLMSDFAVAPTDYSRLAKLVLYAARSREAQLLAERLGRRRIRNVFTTAFTDNPVSMKYRGLFDLYSRKATPDKEHAFMLNYSAPVGTWSLQDGFVEWQKKHGARHD